ncbi:hypothetical protein ACE1CI_14055 [Aerosakkonemataceae cyanobacterium BLCC-F50]|uniref:Uncharacterized protein n=1 Tax=Floridaenema flaviceps BLCC-F50 TaxID=3153642 RepID=A0ABV4XQU3_9CYAN
MTNKIPEFKPGQRVRTRAEIHYEFAQIVDRDYGVGIVESARFFHGMQILIVSFNNGDVIKKLPSAFCVPVLKEPR